MKKILLIIGTVLIVAAGVLYWMYRDAYYTVHIPATSQGVPLVMTEKADTSRRTISSVAAGSSELYLLFSSDRIVEVYDLDGNYRYTYVFNRNVNGGMQMFCIDDILYVVDDLSNLYILENQALLTYLDRESAAEITKALRLTPNDADRTIQVGSRTITMRLSMASTSPDYVIRSGSVWKNTETGQVCVISRPNAETPANILLSFVAILFAKLIFDAIRKKQKKT